MCLTQAIAVALAALLQEDKKGSPEIPTVTGKQRRKG